MKITRDTSLQARLAGIMILCLLIALATVAYVSGWQVKRDSDLIAQDAVPGAIGARDMRMAMSRSIVWVLVAASAQTTQFRDASLKIVHDADVAFADSLKQYETTIIVNPVKDRELLEQLKDCYEELYKRRTAYEAMILAGDHDGAAAFLERDLVPAYLPAIQAAEELLGYNHDNNIAFANSIRSSVHHLDWTVVIVMVLSLICVTVLLVNFSIRRRELAELRESEEKFSKAFQANPSGIAITDFETGRYIEVNESFCRILGYPPQEVIGHTTLDKGIWSSTEERSRILRPLLTGGTLHNQEIQMRARYGVLKTVSLNAELIELKGRRCVVTLIEDITERRRLERKQEELAAIVECSEDAIIGKTTDGIITSWNRGAEKIFGYTAAEAIGQPLLMLIPPERHHEEVEILAKIARGETVRHFETVRVRKDRREIVISVTISPLMDGNGKVTGASKIARDITEQKRAAEVLASREELLRNLIKHTPAAVAMFDSEMRYLQASDRWITDYHLEGTDVIGRSHYDIFPDIPERWREVHRQALRGESERCDEDMFQRADGGVEWLQWEIRPWHVSENVIGGIIMFTQVITKRKHTEELLREKQAQLVRAMNIAKLAHWEFDVVKNIVTGDEHIFQLLGTTPEQEGGFSMSPKDYIRKFVHPEDAGTIAHEVALGIATTDPDFARQFEHRIIRKDGAERVMQVRSRIILDAAGRTCKILGTNQDITEQKEAEMHIRHLNRVYAVLSAINKNIVHEKDPQSMLKEACRIAVDKGGFRMAWVGMFDPTSQKVRPVTSAGVVDGYLDLVDIDLRDKARSGGPSGRAFLSGEHVTCSDIENDPQLAPWREEALKRGYRSSACFPIKTGGRITGIFTLYSGETGFFNEEELQLLDELAMDIGFALEVSEGEAKRRQAEQELRWRTAFFEAQVHSAIDGILVVDSDGKQILQNQRMRELWKIPLPIADDPDDSRQVQFVLGQVKEPQAFAEKVAHLYAHPDESSSDVIELVDGTVLERYSSPVRGSDGTYYGRVWTFHDITERKKLEQQFLRAQRMESIGTLASGVAHDLNNILTPIMISAPVLRMKIPEESRDKIIDTIEMSAARGAQIVKQVLTFGRGLEGEKHPLQVAMLIQEMEKMIRSTFPKDITVESVVEPHLWLVLGDATQLHQVLLNLCVNARDAMPGGGTLRLSAANLNIDASYASMLPESSPGPHVVLEVSDTGSGIPPEIMERIFDPFFTTKGVGKGTGLGLSTVHGIVKNHGGFLKVMSEPDKGTTFQIYLPAAADQKALADDASSAPPPQGHGKLVLVVDDEPAITSTARMVLEANGYRVLLAADATEALVMLTDNSHDIALVLTDIMMPVMNGVLFLCTLRKIKQDIPVIASTGLGEKAHLNTMMALGIETVLHKPYSSNTLLRTVDGVLHPKS
jgi:two-component system cell cycle sensor histidine kinase/response regulator CckA